MMRGVKYLTVITCTRENMEQQTERRLSYTGEPALLDIMRENGIFSSAPCGGSGSCGLCHVEVIGTVRGVDPNPDEILALDKWTALPACKTRPAGECAVRLFEEPAAKKGRVEGMRINDVCLSGIHDEVRLGFAVDLGTTSIALRAVSTADGNVIAELCELNCQRSYGADVMTRLEYCAKEDGLQRLHSIVSNQITRMIADVCNALAAAGVDYKILSAAVAGNTVMLHILANLSPAYLGQAPYRTQEHFGRFFPAAQVGLPVDAYLLPCVGGFAGGDLVGAISAYTLISSGGFNPACNTYNIIRDCLHLSVESADNGGASMLRTPDRNVLICDLGTNGELALWNGEGWLVCSAAAGPALEGGGISCGSGAVRGAVCGLFEAALTFDKVYGQTNIAECQADSLNTSKAVTRVEPQVTIPKIEDGDFVEVCLLDSHAAGGGDKRIPLRAEVIGGCEPVSLCGSALIDLSAILLANGIVTPSGRMPCGEWRLCKGISLTQADLRQLQLAKGAVCAGILTLLGQAELPNREKTACPIIITGGLGSHVKPVSARAIGLIPSFSASRVQDTPEEAGFDEGNVVFMPGLALSGAQMCLFPPGRDIAEQAAAGCEVIELSGSDEFNRLFVECLGFGKIYDESGGLSCD